jgi:hypothetical protein
LTPRSKGTLGEHIIADYLVALGGIRSKSENTGHDIVINNKKIEAKLSLTMTDNKRQILKKNSFMINHLSLKKDFDILFFLGCNHPSENDNVYFWMTHQEVVEEVSLGKYFNHQQGGKKIKNDDYISKPPQVMALVNKYGHRKPLEW